MGTYRLRVPASRVGYVPDAQGGLPPGPTYCTYGVHVPASGVGYVPGTVATQVLGPMSFPRDMVCVFTASLLLALYCKRRAGRAFANRERDAYLRWHTAWHLILPAGAIIGMLLLD